MKKLYKNVAEKEAPKKEHEEDAVKRNKIFYERN